MADAKIVLSADDRASRVLQGLRREMGELQGSTGALRGAFGALAGAFAGAFSVAGLVGLTKAVVNGIDNLNDLADATGDSVENLSALEDVALRTGTSMDTASDAVIKLNKSLDEARRDPNSAAGQAIKNLGLEITELLKLSPVERLQAVGKALNSFDGENKLFYNLTLLGKGTRELAPLMKDLGEAGKLVATMTKEEIAATEKFNKELFALEKNVLDASRALAGPMVSSLNEVSDKLRTGAKEGKSYVERLADVLEAMGLLNPAAPKLDSKAGAGRGFVHPEFVKPTLPDIITGGSGGGKGASSAKRAAEERRRLAEFAAEQLVKLEEITAQETAEAWSFVNKQVIEDGKERADAEKEQWRQVWEFYDQQQEEADQQVRDRVLGTGKIIADEWSVFADQAARNIQDALGDTLQATMEGNFRSIGDLWKRTLDRMVAEALAAKLGQALLGDFGKTGNIGGLAGDAFKWLGALFPSAQGNAFGPGGVLAFAGGGVVDRATPFSFGGGRLGVMGEAGPEGILPLKRGAGGRLGVEVAGGGGPSITIHQHITAPAGADRASRLQLMADIGLATQRAIARNT